MYARGPHNLPIWPGLHGLLLCLVMVVGASCSGVARGAGENIETPLQQREVREVRYVMGTLLDITLYADSKEQGQRALDEAFAVAERLDSMLSTYKEDSDVTQWNHANETGTRAISPELYRLIARSQTLSRQTKGAFDITVRPLVTLWEAAAKHGTPPTPLEVYQVKRLVGFQGLELVPPSSVTLRKVGTQIETGGVGKGFAVDEIVEKLKQRGILRAFINFGRSSMAAIGTSPGQDGWKVDLELEEGVNEGALLLRDETLSVSRARGNPFIVGTKIYAHIFDPALGYPVEISRGAAVRGNSATDGEAYVKYLVARGEPSPAVVREWNAARWIVKAKGHSARSTTDFWK